ncbi:MAG: thiamine-binding protein [Desulfurococcales archaeon]|nr:thiamine-binding protein [Desulfurococcales archaeon]
MPVIAMFYIVPITGKPSVSHLIAKAVKTVKDKGYKFQVTPTATVFEAPTVRDALNTIADAVEAVEITGELYRIIVEIKIDERLDKPLVIDDMPRKVYEKLDDHP